MALLSWLRDQFYMFRDECSLRYATNKTRLRDKYTSTCAIWDCERTQQKANAGQQVQI